MQSVFLEPKWRRPFRFVSNLSHTIICSQNVHMHRAKQKDSIAGRQGSITDNIYIWLVSFMLRPQPCTIAQKNRVHRTVIFNQYICDKFHPTFRHDSCAPLVPNPPFQNNPTVRKCNKTTVASNFMTSFFHTDWVCPPRQLCETLPFQNRRFQCHKRAQKLG